MKGVKPRYFQRCGGDDHAETIFPNEEEAVRAIIEAEDLEALWTRRAREGQEE